MATSGKHRANAWQATIARASADRDSGSWSITTLSAEGLAAAAVEGEPALRAAIALLLAGQPSMAALRNLANTTAWAWTGAPRGAGGAGHARAEGGAAAAARAARAFVERGDAAARAAAACAADVLRQEQARRAVTISAS